MGPLRSTVSIWTSLGILLVAGIVHIVVVAMPDWARFPEVVSSIHTIPSSTAGLWRVCTSTFCVSYKGDGEKCCLPSVEVRDWSLIMGRGGYKMGGGGGGAREVLPLRKGGGGQKKF